ncbi:hypothetical protein ACFT9I_36230 [Streptomyces sp. NPDC057137]|uniref:hypothetical protein n=1 Tax=Streptomyces sp. NPDC057137 TaxID=3346030 RepID=UPI003625F993
MRHRRARAAVLTLGALLVLAPVGVTPKGCGELTGGRLCVEGPVGGEGAFTTRYVRHGAGHTEDPDPALDVQLGYQRKDTRITAFPGWFGTLRTEDGSAALTGRLDTARGECVRGLMNHDGRDYVTEWLCSN